MTNKVAIDRELLEILIDEADPTLMNYALPCDVTVEPRSVFKKGVPLKVLLRGITLRAQPRPAGQLSKEAREERKPLPPEQLVGALQDRIHRDDGRVRIAKSVKVRTDNDGIPLKVEP